ncbi:hypothetical protein Pmani_022228 [Petrolisthes manimaculis]|uniref:Superoxide dismutase [Cu-Zn] n=1 Tax=Petrolisthes manimaculis TaxID=1843537 RepID=A0AAE1U0V3_9EUCA|nr:hypothetical protein Pmani_022228 [Petrolisthes manimaculis]
MGKTVAYVAAAVVFLGIGALAAGLAVWYTHPERQNNLPEEPRVAKCMLSSTTLGAGVSGVLTLTEDLPSRPVKVEGTISGLSDGSHGFHIHQWGVNGAQEGCTDAAGHYNPGNFQHSAPNATERHVGDLGNIISDSNGANVQIEDDIITLWGERSIVGRSIVVHEGEDDLGLGGFEDSTTTGHAGGRVACCTIYLVPVDQQS